jgi:hypothetical protein
MATYTCEKCSYTTDRKLNYDRHIDSEKHKLNCSSAAQQLAELKMKEMEMKNEAKRKEMEAKNELRRIEMEQLQELKAKEMLLKQQIKDEAKKKEEKTISYWKLDGMIPQDQLFYQIIERSTLEDYSNLFHGLITFEELFLRDFVAEYEVNKSVVLCKGRKSGFYTNNHPDLWSMNVHDVKELAVIKLIPDYHAVLKQYAKENGHNTKDFFLSKEEKERIEEQVLELITYNVVYDKSK